MKDLNNELYSFLPIYGYDIDDKYSNWEIRVDCNNCPNFEFEKIPKARYKDNLLCLKCILMGVESINEPECIKNIYFDPKGSISKEDLIIIKSLTEIFGKFKILFSFLKPIHCSNINGKYCIIDCEFGENKTNFNYFIENLWEFLKNGQEISCSSNSNFGCIKCKKKNRSIISDYYNFIKKKEIYNILKKIQSIGSSKSNFISQIFIGPESLGDYKYVKKNGNFITQDFYNIHNFPLYQVLISQNTSEFENFYQYSVKIGEKLPEIYNNIKKIEIEKLSELCFDNIMPIGDILKKYISICKNDLIINYNNLTKSEITNISLLAAVETLQMGKLFPFLVDNSIEEIYLDDPFSSIYIDHQIFGRCRTNIRLNNQEIDVIKTILRISSEKRLNFSNPSIKCTIQNDFFNSRFTVDVTPVQSSGFSLDIRKMNKQIFSLPELIDKGTLSLEIASFLYYCILNRINITVIGETNTGKTTLINSLDLLVPKHFRKIYVEEAPESLNQISYGLHQLKFKVDPNIDSLKSSSKTREIYKLLHRSPDLVYLGEILNRDEAHAMFHCLSTGLRGFQTIHANDLKSLINRWKFHFNIDPSCFNDLGLLIVLKKKNQKRFIFEISEVEYNNPDINIYPIYNSDPDLCGWFRKTDFNNLKTIKQLTLNSTEKSQINDYITLFSNLFDYFVKRKEWKLNKQIQAFNFLTNKIFTNTKMQNSLINKLKDRKNLDKMMESEILWEKS